MGLTHLFRTSLVYLNLAAKLVQPVQPKLPWISAITAAVLQLQHCMVRRGVLPPQRRQRRTLPASTRYGQAKASARRRRRRGVCARCNSFQHWEERTAQKLAAASQLMRCSAVCEALKKKRKKNQAWTRTIKNQGWIFFKLQMFLKLDSNSCSCPPLSSPD